MDFGLRPSGPSSAPRSLASANEPFNFPQADFWPVWLPRFNFRIAVHSPTTYETFSGLASNSATSGRLVCLSPPRDITRCVEPSHYAVDLWVEAWRKKVAHGDVIVVRYTDDLVLGFQNRADAERFLSEFRERLARFDLELHPDKTRLIEFGRFAVRNRKQRGEGKPETFTFLGFTHFCGNLTSSGAFNVWRITAKKRMLRSSMSSRQSFNAGNIIGVRVIYMCMCFSGYVSVRGTVSYE